MNNMTAVFDTLQYAKKLKEAGFTERQAEAQAEALAEIVDDRLATKQDIVELRVDLKRDIKELEYKLVITMGSFLAIGITVLLTLMKVFHI